MSGDPLLRLTGDIHDRFQVVETQRCAIAPRTGLILEWVRKGRREERAFLVHILPDRGLDVATSQRRGRSFGRVVGRYGVSSLREKKVTLSSEEERHRTGHRGNVR